MVAFANPVRGTIHPLGWSRPAGNVDFANIRPFGDMSVPQYGPHNGIDLFNGRAGDPALAAAAGVAEYAAADPMSGDALIVILNHGNGYRTWYAHLGSIAVPRGARVVAGQRVGGVDTTGWASGPHLHFQVQHWSGSAWVNVDPWPLLAQNQTAPRAYVEVVGAGVRIHTTPTADPTTVYRTSTAAYLIGVKMLLGGYVAGGAYRYGSTGQYSGNTWARVQLNGLWVYIAKPYVKAA